MNTDECIVLFLGLVSKNNRSLVLKHVVSPRDRLPVHKIVVPDRTSVAKYDLKPDQIVAIERIARDTEPEDPNRGVLFLKVRPVEKAELKQPKIIRMNLPSKTCFSSATFLMMPEPIRHSLDRSEPAVRWLFSHIWLHEAIPESELLTLTRSKYPLRPFHPLDRHRVGSILTMRTGEQLRLCGRHGWQHHSPEVVPLFSRPIPEKPSCHAQQIKQALNRDSVKWLEYRETHRKILSIQRFWKSWVKIDPTIRALAARHTELRPEHLLSDDPLEFFENLLSPHRLVHPEGWRKLSLDLKNGTPQIVSDRLQSLCPR